MIGLTAIEVPMDSDLFKKSDNKVYLQPMPLIPDSGYPAIFVMLEQTDDPTVYKLMNEDDICISAKGLYKTQYFIGVDNKKEEETMKYFTVNKDNHNVTLVTEEELKTMINL